MATDMLSNREVNHEKDAVMFDIDDTLIISRTSEPISEMINLLHTARTLGYRIVIITARPFTDLNDKFTTEQLHSVGIVPDELLYARAQNKTALKYETVYRYILSVGDLETDLGGSDYWIKLPDAADADIKTNII